MTRSGGGIDGLWRGMLMVTGSSALGVALGALVVALVASLA